ncbi:MAG: fumarylacetoacetate hydrolase family protein [Acidobacteriota bacterium]|jgi:2-keto-4-pentenoate hydratase/2-oxohepta-3-ene-1,7-dioic acid hydratase in catechol pathway
MRLVSFGAPGEERPGLLVEGGVLDLSSVDPAFGGTWRQLLAKGALEPLRELTRSLADGRRGRVHPAGSVRLGPPIVDPGKIVCLGRNYREHAAEQDREVPERPLLFCKASSALAGPADDIRIPPGITHVDYEAEMAFVIGRRGRDLTEAAALDHVAGYMVLNDVTARKLQKDEGQWFRGKSLDTFAPCGPALVTADEVPDAHDLEITLLLNGEVRQSSSTRFLVFGVPFLVAYLSRTMTLEPGDIVSTGTPGGVGVFSEPKVFLRDGDEVVTRIARLGELRNGVRQGPFNRRSGTGA